MELKVNLKTNHRKYLAYRCSFGSFWKLLLFPFPLSLKSDASWRISCALAAISSEAPSITGKVRIGDSSDRQFVSSLDNRADLESFPKDMN